MKSSGLITTNNRMLITTDRNNCSKCKMTESSMAAATITTRDSSSSNGTTTKDTTTKNNNDVPAIWQTAVREATKVLLRRNRTTMGRTTSMHQAASNDNIHTKSQTKTFY